MEAFHNPLIEAVLVAFMVIGAVNFHVHLQLAEGRLREALGSVELRAMLALIAAATAFVAVDLAVNLHCSPLHALRLAAFQVASISTTTGYTSMNVNLLPPASKWLLICLMVVGGSLCSTAGGVKVARAVVLVKLAKLEALRTILPRRAVARLKVGGRAVKEEDALRISVFFFTYIAVAAVATLVLVHGGSSFTSALSAVFSAESGVGPAFIDLFKLDAASKLTLAACMWMGRLELIPVLAMLTPFSWSEAF